MRVCLWCNDCIDAKRANAQFCSPKCQKMKWRENDRARQRKKTAAVHMHQFLTAIPEIDRLMQITDSSNST